MARNIPLPGRRPIRGAICPLNVRLHRTTRTLPSRETTTVRRLDPRTNGRDALERARVKPWGEKVNCRDGPSSATPRASGPRPDQSGVVPVRGRMRIRSLWMDSFRTWPRDSARTRARWCAATICPAADSTSIASSKRKSVGVAMPRRMPVTARTSTISTSVNARRMQQDRGLILRPGTVFVRAAPASGAPPRHATRSPCVARS